MEKIRKTLCVKVSEDFYNKVVDYSFEHHMNISTLLRKALYDAYGLEETNTAAKPRNDR